MFATERCCPVALRSTCWETTWVKRSEQTTQSQHFRHSSGRETVWPGFQIRWRFQSQELTQAILEALLTLAETSPWTKTGWLVDCKHANMSELIQKQKELVV